VRKLIGKGGSSIGKEMRVSKIKKMLWTNFGDEKTLEYILRRYFFCDSSALNIFFILGFRPSSPIGSLAGPLSDPSLFLQGTSHFLSRQTSYIIREEKPKRESRCASQYGQEPSITGYQKQQASPERGGFNVTVSQRN
jgi:hypothetical protein